MAREALKFQVAGLCVNSGYVAWARHHLGSAPGVHLAATVGFPLGQTSTPAKLTEALTAVAEGATELDVVWNLGRFLAGDSAYVFDELSRIREAAGVPIKVILETGWLEPGQIREGTRLAVAAGAALVKTSTGFGAPGASVEAVRIMRDAAPASVGIKASGGIRSLDAALAMIEAGATRLGMSSTAAILDQCPDG